MSLEVRNIYASCCFTSFLAFVKSKVIFCHPLLILFFQCLPFLRIFALYVKQFRHIGHSFTLLSEIRRHGVVVRASALQSVDLGFNPLVESYQKTLKNDIHSFPAWRLKFRGGSGEHASKFACCVLGPPLCVEDKVAQTPRKWQLPSECGRPVQNIAMQFAFAYPLRIRESVFPTSKLRETQAPLG